MNAGGVFRFRGLKMGSENGVKKSGVLAAAHLAVDVDILRPPSSAPEQAPELIPKRFRGKSCYACERPATTDDHVPPKFLFPEQKDLGPKYGDLRQGLITRYRGLVRGLGAVRALTWSRDCTKRHGRRSERRHRI